MISFVLSAYLLCFSHHYQTDWMKFLSAMIFGLHSIGLIITFISMSIKDNDPSADVNKPYHSSLYLNLFCLLICSSFLIELYSMSELLYPNSLYIAGLVLWVLRFVACMYILNEGLTKGKLK